MMRVVFCSCLPEISPEIIEEAYERLKRKWEKELDANSAYREYVVRVLSLLDMAYGSLTKGIPFEEPDLHERIQDVQFCDDRDSLVWLRVVFDKRRKLSGDAVYHFFEKLCIEMVLDFMYRQNRDGQTAYDLAVEHNREGCIQLLNPDNVRENVCHPIRVVLEKCLRGERRAPIWHRPDTPLTSLILQRMPIPHAAYSVGRAISGVGSSLSHQAQAFLSEENLEVVKVVATAPVIGASLPFYCISRSESIPQVLLQVAALPVTVPAATVVSIPVGLFLLAIKAVMSKAL